jgi:TM2 domain-containing membrane protein YozV
MSTCAIHVDRSAAAFCRTCGKALCTECRRDVRGVVYCEDCIAARVQDTVPPGVPPAMVYVPQPRRGPNPVAAALLALIPGVGSMYNGQFMKALVQVVVFAVLIWAGNQADFFGIFVAFWYFYMIFDAYKTARAMELGLPLPDPLGLNRMIGINEGAQNPEGRVAGFAPVNSTAAPGSVPPAPGAAAPIAPVPEARRSGPPTGAIVLIALGVLFLLGNLGLFHFRWFSRFWPVGLIALGVWLFVRRSSTSTGSSSL